MYDDPFDEAPVSKSQRKREAHALQALGESLVKLNKSALAQIPLPNDLRNAIDEARRLHQHGALKRQLQYIGKLMRQCDVEPIRTAFEKVTNSFREDVEQHHELEQWRDRLLSDGDPVLEKLLIEYPEVDRQHLRQLIRTAQKETASGKPPKAARELFRYLREVLAD
ncbi:MAG: ribosome biogenesis factor YjgA [Gammaproteobacteria bacterium]